MGLVNEALINKLSAYVDSSDFECLKENEPATQVEQKRR